MDDPTNTTARPSSPFAAPWRRSGALVLSLVLGFGACAEGGSAPTEPPGGEINPPGEPPPYNHALGPGASAADLLAGDDFDSLVVQVSYVEGHRPTDEGLQILEEFILARLHKPAGISIRVAAPLQIASQATYTVSEVRDLEEQHRTEYTRERTLAVHFLFLGGEFADQANVLGFAYNNTSMAIFEEKIRAHSGGISQPTTATVEGVVLNHELGHLLGLVNNGSTMQTEHQDEPHGRHCDDPDCLMYYAVRTTDFISNLLGGMPTLDQNCLDDLAANGGR